MTEKTVTIITPKATSPSWEDVKSGDFIKVKNVQTPCLVYVSQSELVTLIGVTQGVMWNNRDWFDLPTLEKIYSKAEITLHD